MDNQEASAENLSPESNTSKTSYIVVDEDKARHLGKDNTFSGETPTQEFHTPVEAVKAAYGARQEHAEDLEYGQVRVQVAENGNISSDTSFITVDKPGQIEISWKKISNDPVPDEVKDIASQNRTYAVVDDQYRQLDKENNFVFSGDTPTNEFSNPVEAVKVAYGARQEHAAELEGGDVHVHSVVAGEIVQSPTFRVVDEPGLLEHTWRNISDHPVPDEVKEFQREFSQSHNIVGFGVAGQVHSFEGTHDVGIHQIDSHGIPRQIDDDHFDKLINEKGFSFPKTTKTGYVSDGVEDKRNALSKGYVNNDQSKQVSDNDQSVEVSTTRSFQISLSKSGKDKPFTTTNVTVSHGVDEEKTQAILKENVKQIAMSSEVNLKDVSAKVMRQKDVQIDYSKNISLGKGFGESLGE